MVWQNRRVLVTGSAGVIGRVLVKKLVEGGAHLLSVDVASSATIEPRVEHLQADLSQSIPDRLRDFEPEVVFHLAAIFERTEEEAGYWKSSFDHNVLLSHRLLRALAETPSLRTFVFASSYLIYDPRLYIGSSDLRFLRESDPVAPRNLVGAAKYFAEQELAFVAESEQRFRAISARIYRVYGRDSRDVISRWVRAALAGMPLEVYGSAAHFDYIFADDVAEGLMRLVEAEQAQGIINLGSGKPRRVADIVAILQQAFPNLQVNERQTEGALEASGADMTLFRQLTGWEPETALEEGIPQLIAYYRKQAR